MPLLLNAVQVVKKKETAATDPVAPVDNKTERSWSSLRTAHGLIRAAAAADAPTAAEPAKKKKVVKPKAASASGPVANIDEDNIFG